MIADCAVEPEVVATWRHFQSLHEDFGVSRGRLISKFPKKWMKEVAERSGELVLAGINTEIQAAKIEERLKSDRFKRKLKSPGGREYDASRPWLENATNTTPPFDLIVASGAGAAGNKVGAEDLLKDEQPFHRTNQCQVRRRKEHLIGAAESLLKGSTDVIIVDPNFRADEPRFVESLKYLVDCLDAHGRPPRRLEVHTCRIRKPGETFLRGPHASQWRTHFVPALPEGWQVTICYWDRLPSGGKPHARFLLTDSGGIYFDHGIDEGDGETLVTLLEDEVWDPLFKTFHADALPAGFDPDLHVMIFKR